MLRCRAPEGRSTAFQSPCYEPLDPLLALHSDFPVIRGAWAEGLGAAVALAPNAQMSSQKLGLPVP